MAKKKKAGSARDRRIREGKTAVTHVKKLETQVKGLSRHLRKMLEDPHREK
jgi:hypothetical protein